MLYDIRPLRNMVRFVWSTLLKLRPTCILKLKCIISQWLELFVHPASVIQYVFPSASSVFEVAQVLRSCNHGSETWAKLQLLDSTNKLLV